MSIYAQAVQSGLSAAQLAFTGENAQTKAAYNQSFAEQAARLAAAERKHTAEKNISAIKQDKILSNTQIQMSQDQAEAFAKVNAAAAGVQGQSVEDVVYQTEANETYAMSRNKRQADQRIESELARVNSAQASLLSVTDSSPNVMGDLLNAFSSFERKDFKISEALNSKESTASSDPLSTEASGQQQILDDSLPLWGG